jgi:chromosome segregation ATPase
MFTFEPKEIRKQPMHRRVNSNIIDINSKPLASHRRTLSNSDLKATPSQNFLSLDLTKSKSNLILPDSLNSSIVQHLQNEEPTFIETLDFSIKHFSNFASISNPIKQINDLKTQINFFTKNIETLKKNKVDINSKYIYLKDKVHEIDQENYKLQEYINQLQAQAEKLKVSVKKSENELKYLKNKNQKLEFGSISPPKNDQRNGILAKNPKYTNSSSDEIDMFNAEEKNCIQFDVIQFGNPSPRIQPKNLYARPPLSK